MSLVGRASSRAGIRERTLPFLRLARTLAPPKPQSDPPTIANGIDFQTKRWMIFRWFFGKSQLEKIPSAILSPARRLNSAARHDFYDLQFIARIQNALRKIPTAQRLRRCAPQRRCAATIFARAKTLQSNTAIAPRIDFPLAMTESMYEN